MTPLSPTGILAIADSDLEYRFAGPQPDAAPTLILLHEGLGSAGLWGNFPDQLAERAGCGVFAYSRAGYGQSSATSLPRQPDYMHREALEVLPRVLEAIGFQRGILIGHSDGASIATVYAGGIQDHRVRGVALLAPHFIVEDISIQSIAAIATTYKTTDLKSRLGRWHRDPNHTFRGWNDVWLDPRFRDWNISESLAYIRVPIAIVQGMDDEYGTARQIQIAREECYCPVDVTMLVGVGHAPHREAPAQTLDVLTDFATRILRTHEGDRFGGAASL